jgi:hypothetical protein
MTDPLDGSGWFSQFTLDAIRQLMREDQIRREQVERISFLIEELYLEADFLKQDGRPVASKTTRDLADRLTVEMVGARLNRTVGN